MVLLPQRLLQFTDWFSPKQNVILFDTPTAANEIAFMLGGEWDGCNGVVLNKCDEVAVNTAASLIQAQWCYSGAEVTYLTRLTANELLRRYQAGEKNFTNANLRGVIITSNTLVAINLSWAKLSGSNLWETNLSYADLTAADFTNADLSLTNLSGTTLTMCNLNRANLSQANLKESNLYRACLKDADLTQADLTGANLTLADLTGANLSQAKLTLANLEGAKVVETELAKAELL